MALIKLHQENIMQNNIGAVDRSIRILAGVGLLLWVTVFEGPVWAWLGLLPLATALIRWCPLFTLIGIRSE